jgi:hypothetical protein
VAESCLDSVEFFYPHIFSFNEVLPTFETGQVIVSALIALDCQTQVRAHILGMMRKGATKDEITYVREICVMTIKYWGPKPFGETIAVPDVNEQRVI